MSLRLKAATCTPIAMWNLRLKLAGMLLVFPFLTAAQSRVRVQVAATPANGPAPLSVSFTARGFPPSAESSSPATYAWIFDDAGATSNIPNPRHTYSKPGRYRATVIYTRFINRIDPPELREQATNSVLVIVTAPAALQIAPGTLSFNGQQTGTNPDPQSLILSNSGGSPLHWAVSNDSPAWLSLSAENGALVAGQSSQVKVSSTNTTLTTGRYQARLVFSSP